MTASASGDILQEIVVHEEPLLQSAEFWVGVIFVFVMSYLCKPLYTSIKRMIDDRIKHIRQELSDAENLKLDAQKLYAEYERKFINTENEVSELIANQQAIIEQTKEKKLQELELNLIKKQKEAESKIEQLLKSTEAEINAIICKKALDSISKVIRAKLTKTDYNKLIDSSINNIKNIEIGEYNE